MASPGFALFETAIGCCAVAWGERGLRGVQLPEASERATRARMKARFPGVAEAEPPRDVRRAVAAMKALLAGKATDLSTIALDLDGVPPFRRRVYEAARAIPPGRTMSYGGIAAAIGSPGSARAVGGALGRNPFPVVVPCHRVLAAGGKAGGFTAEGGVDTKMRMLEIEGARIPAAASARPSARHAGATFDAAAAVRGLRKADPVLARLIAEVGPCRLEVNETRSVFAALSHAIVYQQLTGKAAATIHGRVCALFPRAKDGFTPRHILGAGDDELRGAGLSRAKAAALRDLAQKTVDGAIPTLDEAHAMPDDEIVGKLTAVRGVGRWTVEMLLMFRLGRPDVLPADDYGVRKGFAVAFRRKKLPTRKELEKYGERWAPWRTTASWYLWRAADSAARRAKE
jgi:methylated-DNA-[protein]-cysteine S-methyltransferase